MMKSSQLIDSLKGSNNMDDINKKNKLEKKLEKMKF